MSVSIKYKGAEIASADTEVTKTIKTSGKYCEADIIVENTPDGGADPVINPFSVTENGTYTAPSGVDGYSPVTVNVPQGITPSGNINITDTNVTDVTNYATAQVVSENLKPENIKKSIDILGVVGTFEGGGEIVLPEGYTRYSYIESSGTQYINTGVNPTDSIGCRAIISLPVGGAGDNVYVAGSRTSGDNNRYYVPAPPSWQALGWNAPVTSSVGSAASTYGYREDVKLNYMQSRKFEVWDREQDLTGAYNGSSSPIFILNTSVSGTPFATGYAKLRLHEFWISDGQTIAHHYIPAMRDADSVLGLYDVIGNQFKTNAGTGTFTGGALS